MLNRKAHRQVGVITGTECLRNRAKPFIDQGYLVLYCDRYAAIFERRSS